jgi:sensor histidine kinase YesM
MKRFLTSIWLLGLVIAIPVIISLPGLFRKYKSDLVLQETAAHSINYRIFFRDLDGNGIKQKVYAFPNSAGQLAFQYFSDEGAMINQINFRHKFSTFLLYLFFGDADKNGKTEVYGFTLEKDSLFLNMAELINPYSNNSESHYITRVGTFENGTLNFSVNRFAVADIDTDGNNEIVFSVVSGYSKFPRMVVIYHPETGKLVQSIDNGMNPYFMSFYDLNRDGKMEILAGSSAGFNLTDTTTNLATDIRPYLLSYDSDLKFFFPPIPFSSGINNHLQVFVNNLKRKEILVFQFNRSLATEKILGIYKVDFAGNLIDSMFLPKFGKRFPYQVFQEKGYYWLYTGDKMVSIDNRLNINEVKDIEKSNSIFRNPLSYKGCPEYATLDLLMKKVCLYTEDFGHKIEMEYADETIRNIILDIGKGPEYFMVQTNNNEYTYRILKNWLYYLKFPFYILIYLLSVLFVWLIQRIREKQLHERYELQNQLRDVEIKYLRMQMDPHFMFNAFNSMALLMKNGEQEEAFDAFMKFTKMVRSNFDFSDRFSRPLSEEMQMVNHFLDINKLRFREKLDFRITIAEDVPMNMLIPKMMLQIHIENALKHGLAKLEKSGTILIYITREEEGIRVTIEDNGIGRRKAAQMNTDSTKQGLKMLQAMYERLSQQSKTKIIQVITDLMDEQGNPAGTRVEIFVPLNLKEIPGV